MNLIVERAPDIKWYSDLYPFVTALGAYADNFCWLCTGGEVFPSVREFPDGSYWLSAADLREIIEPRYAFGWCVLSAIPLADVSAAMTVDCYPYADCNPGFWIGSPKPQHPMADFEVVCWDSSATLLIGASQTVAAAFLVAYPSAVDLDKLIEQHDRARQST